MQTHDTFRTIVTRHAAQRMRQRGIRPDAMALALAWGDERFHRGALVSVITRTAVQRASRAGVDISHLRGLVVLQAADASSVVTTYFRR